jgi:hypothetical protein
MDNLIDINDELKRRKEIDLLKKQIQDLIAERPNLAAYQKRIEEELKKAGDNPDNRLAIIQNLFIEQKTALLKALANLKGELENIKNCLKKED